MADAATGDRYPRLVVACPDWVRELVDWDRDYPGDDDRMELAIALARENVRRGTGGPFGAAVFTHDGGLVSVGVNSVVRSGNCTLHGETMALMMAQYRQGSFTLDAAGLPSHELVSSCDPCAMCLGAVLWSGVRRLVSGATRTDALALGFDEGPVFPESFRYLEARGIAIVHEVRRAEARAVLEDYLARGGQVYNG